MKKITSILNSTTKPFIYLCLLSTVLISGYSVANTLSETREIIYTGEGAVLANKAAELQTPAAIYEYVRNTHEYALYHGSRSNTINTFLGQRGSDVDIASVLIAMYRSQNISARYAVGTVSAPAVDVANWLGVKNTTLAASIMDNQGIQSVNMANDGGTSVIEFEHAWVQVLVPYDYYRGAITSSTDCTVTPAKCQWINIDPSWKLREFHNQGIDIYNVVNFDYTRYYNAIKDNDAQYRDKNPLEIYEELILNWLQVNHPGKTLDDVADPGTIIAVNDGVLPASLPFKVISAITTFDSIDDHDADASQAFWAKQVTFNMEMAPGFIVGMGEYYLADLSTRRLTLTYEQGATSADRNRVVVRLDGVEVRVPFEVGTLNINGEIVDTGFVFTLTAELDGAPATVMGEEDSVVDVRYEGLTVGGYFLLGTGGDTSNWSQVHRAADQLLQANDDYALVFDTSEAGCDTATGFGCTPYVDDNGNGFDSSDTPLLDSPEAQDALTGGLLYVAMNQYFTRFTEGLRQLDGLNHIVSPIEGFIGIVSSTYEVEYLDSTAFSVMPGGLLIDMKGQSFNGVFRDNDANTFANEHFTLVGHLVSSLEHEIWQELTGFDAVSTVRGIQMALTNNSVSLLDIENNGVSNNMSGQYTALNFGTSSSAGFTHEPYTIYSSQPSAWRSTSTSFGQMDILKIAVSDTSTQAERAATFYNYFGDTFGYYGAIKCADDIENQLATFPPLTTVTVTYCDGATFNDLAVLVRDQIETYFYDTFVPDTIGQELFDLFDRAQGFDETDYVFRGRLIASNEHATQRIRTIRDDVMIGDRATFGGNNGLWRYIIPSRKTEGDVFRFSVMLEQLTNPNTNATAIQSYLISNDFFTAGGGWVDGTETLNPSIPNSSVIKPDFNNEVFTDENLVAQTNNDLVRTPSTADPVSTVTGNMYHDETDITIKGRGLPYVFTRSYNSGPGRADQDGPLGYGWTHSYNMSLRSNDYGDCPSCNSTQASENENNITSSISYIDERGGEHTYILNADGAGTRSVAANPPGEFESLQLNTPSNGQHTLLFRNGVKYVFSGAVNLVTTPDQTARLEYIEDPYNNRLTLGYDGNGRLISVTDNLAIAGRTGLSLTYHGSTSHIHTVSDWSGRIWTYQYDANDNLDSMTDPLNQVMDYTYHADTHLLNAIIHPQLRNSQQKKMAFSYYRNNKAFNYINTLGETETLDYDLYRQRTQVTDPRGFIRTHVYDTENGALIKLEEPDGAILRFANNADGLRYKKTDGLGYETQYSFQANRSISEAASNTNGLVTREIDALNQSIDYNYAIYDQPANTVDKRGTTFRQQYHTTTDSAARTVEGKLRIEQVVMNGQTETLRRYYYYADPTQSNFGQLQRIQDFFDPGDTNRRSLTRFYWAANGIDLERVDVYGLANGQITTDINRTTYTYDDLGRRLSETLHRRTSATDATQQQLTTHYEYDVLDRIIKTTNPRGDIAEVVYDENGQVYQQKVHYLSNEPREHCTATVMASLNYQSCTYITNTYDAADRLIETTDILGHSQQFSYDALGNVIKQRDANGNETRFEYDAMNRRTAIIDANGYKTQFVYDLAGRLIETIDANDHRVKHTYDAIGRLTKSLSEEGRETAFTYDANGNLTHTLDANATAHAGHPRNAQNATVYTEYDELNRPVRVVDALDGETLTEYDLQGNITRITDAEGQVTQFMYDELGRLIETIDPIIENGTDLTKKTTLYNEANQPLIREDRAGNVFHYGYDVLGRLTTVDVVGDSYIERYNYNDFGDLASQGNTSVNYLYDYTSRHEMQQKTDIRENKTLNWVYDAAGNVITKTDYQGEVTHYQYDSTNRLTAMQNRDYLQVSYHYDGAGRLLNRILSNGAQTNYKYDDDNRLIELENLSLDPANPTQKQTVEKLVYQRDEVGNIIQVNNAAALATVDYGYDALYRLTSVDSSFNSADRAYTYDKVGNRKTETKNGTTYYYCYHVTDCSQPPNGNRLHNIRTGSLTGPLYRQYAYDVRGNITTRRDGNNVRLAGFSYNAANQATRLFNENGDIRFAGYDVLGYRVGTGLTGSFSQVVEQSNYYLEGEHIEAIYTDIGCSDVNPSESSGCTTEDAVFNLDKKYLRGVVVDEIVNGYDYHSSDDSFNENDWTNTTFHHDHINSVTALTGHDGRIEETYGFDAFGMPLSAVNSDNALLFTGREYDAGTATYYYRARYYDPEIGRFISEDPLGFEAGINFYAYVNNNPVNFNDPSGKLTFNLGFGGSFVTALGGEGSVGVVLQLTDDSGAFSPDFGVFNSFGPAAGADIGVDLIQLGFQTGGIKNSFEGTSGNFTTDFGLPFVSGTGTVTSDIQNFGGTLNLGLSAADLLFLGTGVPVPEIVGSIQETNVYTIRDAVSDVGDGLNYLKDIFLGPASGPTPGNTGGRYPDNASVSNNGASGGFVLYPSKPNTNTIQRVYSK